MILQKRSLMVLLLALAILASACQANASAASQPQTSTAMASRGTLVATVSAAGTIAAQAQVAVQFQNSGQVKAVNVKACAADVKQHCADVKAGEGRLEACMKSHVANLSDACKVALANSAAGDD